MDVWWIDGICCVVSCAQSPPAREGDWRCREEVVCLPACLACCWEVRSASGLACRRVPESRNATRGPPRLLGIRKPAQSRSPPPSSTTRFRMMIVRCRSPISRARVASEATVLTPRQTSDVTSPRLVDASDRRIADQITLDVFRPKRHTTPGPPRLHTREQNESLPRPRRRRLLGNILDASTRAYHARPPARSLRPRLPQRAGHGRREKFDRRRQSNLIASAPLAGPPVR